MKALKIVQDKQFVAIRNSLRSNKNESAKNSTRQAQWKCYEIRGDIMIFPRGVKCWRVRRQYSSTVGSNHFSALRDGVDVTPYTHLGRITLQHEMMYWKWVRDAAPTPFLCPSILLTVNASITTLDKEPSRLGTGRMVPNAPGALMQTTSPDYESVRGW